MMVIIVEDLKNKCINLIVDVLSDIEGVDISFIVGKIGGLNICICGMDLEYIFVLIDGCC